MAPLTSFSLQKLRVLEEAIEEIDHLKLILFGYLFAKKKLRAIAKRLKEQCAIESDGEYINLKRLKVLRDNVRNLRDHLAAQQLDTEFSTAVFLIVAKVAGPNRPFPISSSTLERARRLQEAVSQRVPMLAGVQDQFYPALLAGHDGPLTLLLKLADLKRREARIAQSFVSGPKVDYIGAKAKIESLNAQTLAEHIDDKFINFYNNKKTMRWLLGRLSGKSSASLPINFLRYKMPSRASSPVYGIMQNLFRWNAAYSIW
jgi:hypothetical protein